MNYDEIEQAGRLFRRLGVARLELREIAAWPPGRAATRPDIRWQAALPDHRWQAALPDHKMVAEGATAADAMNELCDQYSRRMSAAFDAGADDPTVRKINAEADAAAQEELDHRGDRDHP